MQTQKDCKCTVSTRDHSCKKSHNLVAMEREMKIRPEMFMPSKYNSSNPDTDSSEEEVQMPVPLQRKVTRANYPSNGKMIEDEGLQTMNRKVLRKFEALDVSGRSLTGLSIGGFEVDLNVAAQKAMEVLPMPAAKLPVIFLDEELNFFHHFFQGVTQVIGEGTLKMIAAKKTYYEDEVPVVFRMIEDMILEGYDKSDKEIVIFLKKVFCSTFELTSKSRRTRESESVKVCANLWGFPYIEYGMMMEEQDLQMWISVSYDRYRTSWFNTFKSSGVPSFAHEGSGKARSMSSISSGSNSDRQLGTVHEEDNISVSSRHSTRSRNKSHHRRSRQSSTSPKVTNAMIKYLSGQ
jgi:hypothetical protein